MEVDPELKIFVKHFDSLPQKFTSLTSFLNAIVQQKAHGIAKVNIRVPDNLKEFFEELPPIFKNTVVES